VAARLPRLLAISDHASGARGAFSDWLDELVRAGVDGIQIREKDLDDRDLFDLTRQARQVLPPGFCLLVNGRLDIALAAGADGVHLPAAGVPVGALRERFGQALIIGRSTHLAAEVGRARLEGADYVTFGPVYATPSKARYGPPAGLEGLRQAAAHGLPIYALGGVTIERLSEVAAAGAAGAAGIRCFREADRLPDLVREATQCFPREPDSPGCGNRAISSSH
jgi:thiamine-phosphate pyrophosphorylase